MDTGMDNVLVAAGNMLGECPIWDYRCGRLLWIDPLSNKFWQYDSATEESCSYDLPEIPGSFALTPDEGVYLMALGKTFQRWGPEQGLIGAKAEVPDELNDGRVDRRGRFVCGGISPDRTASPCSIYRVDAALRVEVLVRGVSCTNGLNFSLDGGRMFFTDSRWEPPRLAAVPYPLAEPIEAHSAPAEFTWPGAVGRDAANRAVFEEGCGVVDGLCVDSEGGLWAASFGGGRVARYVAGREVESVAVPVPHVTCACLGGPDLCTLFVTNGSRSRGVDSLHAGAVHAFRVAVPGVREELFR